MEITNLKELLAKFENYPKKEKNAETFLEIAGCPHYENVWSNILGFYLNPNASHGFGDMLLKIFLNLIKIENNIGKIQKVNIKREYKTEKNNRLDIVVVTDSFVLGIENKVNASLYNDLKDYAHAIEKLANRKPSYKIVLSKYRSSCDNGFINVLYSDLINQLPESIRNETQNKYQILFKDFIETIENEINENPMNNNPELVKFFTENHTEIADLLAYSNHMNDYVFKKLQSIHRELRLKFNVKKEQDCFSQNGNYLSCLYFKVNESSFCCQTEVKINAVNFYTSFYPTEKSKISALEGKVDFTPTFSATDSDELIVAEIEKQILQIIEEIEKAS